MNKINPLYILALFLTLFIISIFLLNQKKYEHKDVVGEYAKIKVLSNEFKDYKDIWFKKESLENTINKLINNSIFKKEKILKVKIKNGYKIKIESANQKTLDSFLNKLLNERVQINKLEIEKDFIQVEIGI